MVNLSKNNRIQSFDIARTFAIMCVVLCHSVETAYSNINYTQLSNISQIFRIVFFTVGRLGVPIFLFLTGALTLKKQIENDEEMLSTRIRELYKNGTTSTFNTLTFKLNSESLGELIDRINYTNKIIDADNKLIEEHNDNLDKLFYWYPFRGNTVKEVINYYVGGNYNE